MLRYLHQQLGVLLPLENPGDKSLDARHGLIEQFAPSYGASWNLQVSRLGFDDREVNKRARFHFQLIPDLIATRNMPLLLTTEIDLLISSNSNCDFVYLVPL